MVTGLEGKRGIMVSTFSIPLYNANLESGLYLQLVFDGIFR